MTSQRFGTSDLIVHAATLVTMPGNGNQTLLKLRDGEEGLAR